MNLAINLGLSLILTSLFEKFSQGLSGVRTVAGLAGGQFDRGYTSGDVHLAVDGEVFEGIGAALGIFCP